MTTPGYRESHLDKGVEYHDSFSSMPHRAMVWRLERRLVLRMVQDTFAEQAPRHLDFACGTGRFLELLSPVSISSTGLDVSTSMLKVARDRLKDVELIECDITRTDCLGDRQFDLITAFRFLPNAEPDLRRDSLMSLKRHLAPNGILLFNNHMNRDSLVRRLIVALRRTGTNKQSRVGWGMSRCETHELACQTGFRIEREFPLAVLPFTDRHMFYPASILEKLEDIVARISWAVHLAQNLVYLCQHEDQANR